MTCKDCDRRIVCRYYTQWANVEQVETDRCQYFKNKADVVEVVRCKDCFFYQKDKELAKANYLDSEKYCALLICEIDKNGFCSYGKRMDGETE